MFSFLTILIPICLNVNTYLKKILQKNSFAKLTIIKAFGIIKQNCVRARKAGEVIGITIKEIAEMSGVSRGTVDRVLHNRPGVSQENIDKVNKIIKEYDYKPNFIAKALAIKQQKKKIGIILNCQGNRFFDDVLEGVYTAEKELLNFGTETEIIKLKGYVPEEQIKAIDDLVKKNIDGLIISPINDENIKNKLESLDIPVITCNMDIDIKNKVDYIGCDYNISGKIAGAVLNMYAFGKKINVGIVHGSKNIKGHIERYEAFKEVAGQCENVNIIDYFYTEDDSVTAYENTAKLLKQNAIDFIYVVASGIEGVIEAISESGREIYAITNDVLPVTIKYLEKDIIKATVYQHPFKQGYNAVSEMVSYICGGNINKNNYKINLEIITKYNIPIKN